ncbi:Kinesin-like protein, partial [Globisporangium splendens]
MSVSMKVSIRCRPFTCDDKLGVVLTQSAEEEGEVQLINSTYSTTRFGFSYAWWSAYGYQRHVQGDPPEVDQMTLIDQQAAYDSVGLKIKSDLLSGNAVVLFAYGLSGSGKTFTVFGPDAVDIPEAWFKHEEPQPLWGIFPRLAYELFKEKQDGWKISMKYFQNVVDTVRDLMSPVAQEQQYKSGMRKDADGFTDIEWCQSVVLKDWNDLRKNFMAANAKKAIAPTQFNHQSTRGHCIMTLEVEKPDPEREGMKQRGRVYVCDLAGTEPAGDIVYAEYKKIVFDNGEIEHKYIGPHPDASKSKELQDQGKKINLSLTEMAQFFMKMAEAVKANKLKPDTMLQARTYLFCAIRPEVKFHGYTFSTLGFAKNASVIKLQPKKASAAASAAERKLMAELEQMKMLVNQLKEENERMAKIRAERGDGGGAVMAGHDESGMDTSQVDQLSELLNMKQRELEKVVNGESDGSGVGKRNAQDEMMQRQREEYGKRDIHLYHFESETKSPYLINLDVDAYRSKRFMFLLDKPHITVGGMQGDIKPMLLSIVDGHCTFTNENDGETISVVAGAGDVMHNGKKLERGSRQELTAFDHVVIGNELMLFMYPGREPAQQEPPTADDAAAEYQKALQTVDNAAIAELQAQMKKFEEEKTNWEKQKVESEAAGSSASSPDLQASAQEAAAAIDAEKEKELLARQVNDQELREVLPKIVELQQIVKALNRDVLSFETALQSSSVDEKNSGGIPKVKVKVYNKVTDETIFLDVFEFVKAHALLKDEVAVSSLRKHSLSQRIDGDDTAADHEQGSGSPSDSGVARAPLATSDVTVKRSRTKKSIRKVSKLVRQVSTNLRDSVAEVLDYPFNRQLYLHLGDKFALVGKVELMEMRLFVHVQTKHSVTGIEKATVPTGLGSVLGNKGGLIFKMMVQDTSLCFVSCHLAAHQDQKFLDKRNSDCASILGINFAMKKVSLDHQFDHCFWFGNLNYCVNLNYTKPRERSSEQHFAEVLACVRAKKWTLLNSNDQLKHQIEEKKALSGWELPPALFPPTFKRIRHAPDEYNPQRIPSYCDRVLHKSLPGRRAHLKLQRFTCIESISSSDHKPVRAEFLITPTPPIALNTTLSTAQATRVEITELCAKDLIGMDMTGLSDPYIKFYSVPQHALQVEPPGSHPSTTTIMSTLSPVWRDEQVPKLYVQCAEEKDVKLVHLILLFMDYDTTSADDVLGVTTLSLDKYCLARPRFVPFDVPIVRYGKAAGSVSGKIRVTMPHQADMVRADTMASLMRSVFVYLHDVFEQFVLIKERFELVARLAQDEHSADEPHATRHRALVEPSPAAFIVDTLGDRKRARSVPADAHGFALHHGFYGVHGLRRVHGDEPREDAADDGRRRLLRRGRRVNGAKHLRAHRVQLLREHGAERQVTRAPDAITHGGGFEAAEEPRDAERAHDLAHGRAEASPIVLLQCHDELARRAQQRRRDTSHGAARDLELVGRKQRSLATFTALRREREQLAVDAELHGADGRD